MIDECQEELASLYALDLLEGAERVQFEAAIARDPALQALVRELRESSSALAHTVPPAEAPGELKARVLASIKAERPRDAASADDEKIIRPAAFGFWSFVPWAAAACLAVSAGWFAYRGSVSQTEASLLREQQTLAALTLKSAQNQLEAERIINQRRFADFDGQIARLTAEMKRQGDLANLKITVLASMLENSPKAVAVAVWDPLKQNGVLKMQNMPALAWDQDYQFWVVDEANPTLPVDAGIVAFDAGTGETQVKFTIKEPVKAVAAFAVSRERKGGVPKREGPIVLLGK